MRIETHMIGAVAVVMAATLAIVLYAVSTRSMAVDSVGAGGGPVALAAMY